jgi:hypothetical protein
MGRLFLDGLLKIAFPSWSMEEILQVRAEFNLGEGNVPDIGVLTNRQCYFQAENYADWAFDRKVPAYLQNFITSFFKFRFDL